MRNWLKKLTIPQQIVMGFLITVLVGAVLLTLPFSAKSQQATPFLDALFTATSAVAVTGQTVVNTANHWTLFGKTVIITLIEIGALGFMSIIVMIFVFMGKKMTLKQRLLVQEAVNLDNLKDAQSLIRYIVKLSLIIQAIGAFFLSLDFIPRLGFAKGLYYSVFHSISAFANAGFDLFGDSLMSFQKNPLVMLTISFLIIFGGLGFLVWRDLLSYPKRKKLAVHTRLTLITTLSILLISFVLFSISEARNGTFAHLPLPYRILNYFFMAVTPRTAGYANIDYRKVSHMGIALTLILMFIGASSGSTGGGIKVTTFATVVLFIKSRFTGEQVRYHHRSIPKKKVDKALLLTVFGIVVIVLGSFVLFITEQIPDGFGIEYVLVEVVSVFGTVGLTMGLTEHITQIGKVVLIIIMFTGRVGLLTFLMSMGARIGEKPEIEYPEENILIG